MTDTQRIAFSPTTPPSNNGHHMPPETPPNFLPGKKKRISQHQNIPTDDELAAMWASAHPLSAYGLGEFRRYDQGYWAIVRDDTIESELLDVLQNAKLDGIRPTARILGSVRKLASILVGIEVTKWNADYEIVVCKNGTLHIPTLTLREHRPEDYQTSALPFDYAPKERAIMWEYAINSTIPDVTDFLQEFSGYALTTDTRYELAIWLYGPRGSGKSTILTGLQTMLGERAGILGLADIERSTFALANLPGKTLVISTEQPASYMQSSHILNALISGEMVHVDRKYREPIDITTHAKIAWAMNEMPRIPDAGDGLFRRVKVIKFPKLGSEADPKVKETIKTEGAGILNWALEGLTRLHARGGFNIPKEVDQATQEFQETNDVPATFVESSCYTGDEYKTGAQTLYDAYRQWCIDNGHKPQSSTSLAREWERLDFASYKSDGHKYYKGVGLKSETISL